LILPRFEDVIVQNEPAAPVYSEHSFVTWRGLCRSEEADTGAAPVLNARVRATTGIRGRTEIGVRVLTVICLLLFLLIF
jgi:hypothetical protein